MYSTELPSHFAGFLCFVTCFYGQWQGTGCQS